MDYFIRLLLSSLSLGAVEKYQVIEKIPTLCQRQVDQLIVVFIEELDTRNKQIKYWDELVYLVALTWELNCMLANFLGIGFDEVEERQLLKEMLEKKYDDEEKRSWLSGLPNRAVINWFFKPLKQSQYDF